MTTAIPRDPSSEAELRQALAIVGHEYGEPRPPIPGVDRFGELFLFTQDERDQLYAMRDLIGNTSLGRIHVAHSRWPFSDRQEAESRSPSSRSWTNST